MIMIVRRNPVLNSKLFKFLSICVCVLSDFSFPVFLVNSAGGRGKSVYSNAVRCQYLTRFTVASFNSLWSGFEIDIASIPGSRFR